MLDGSLDGPTCFDDFVEKAGTLTGVGKAELAATRISARSAVADTIRQSLDGDLGRFSVES